jgi:glutamate carboxypeptidase
MRQKFENSAYVEFFGNWIRLIAHYGIVKNKIIHIVVEEIVMPMRKTEPQQSDIRQVSEWLLSRKPAMIATVRDMVERESPTHDKQACDALCAHLAAKFGKLGGKIRLHRQRTSGNHLEVAFSGSRNRRPILLLGHFDTVYDLATLKKMPWREEKGKLSGPGVFDMKSGIAQMMFAIEALQSTGVKLPRPVKILLVSDEEEGSATSRAITERLAKQCAAVLVCEPSGPGGALKTARKGVGSFTLKVIGHSAHSGLDFEKGHSAIVELAHQIHAITQLTDLKHGITLNVGVIRGGTRTNVVAAEASAEVDLRIAHKKDGARMERKVFSLRPVNRNCQLEISGGVNRPPLERTRQVAALFSLARTVGRELGLELKEIAVGGGSDGNFTAGLGVPTLDGLGGVGDGAHAAHEYVIADDLPRRAALLAGLIQAIT